jgi:hypothetical protein
MRPDPPNASDGLHRDYSFPKLCLAVAAIALGQVLQTGHQEFTVPAVIWLTVTLVSTLASVLSQRFTFPRIPRKVIWGILITGLIVQIFQLAASMPGHSIPPENFPKLRQFQIIVLIGGLCALFSLLPERRFSRRLRNSLAVIAVAAVLAGGIWIIRNAPDPYIDVYVFHQTANKALLEGKNPYVQTPPNIYGDMEYYGARFGTPEKLNIGNPYPPLTILLDLLGSLLTGDVRYLHLLAILAAGLLMMRMLPDKGALLIGYIFLYTPRLYFIVEQSWTEPLVVFFVVIVVWSMLHRPKWRDILLGLMMASKQYMLLMFPLIFKLFPPGTPRKSMVRSSVWVLGTGFAVTAPMAFWNLPAFLWNVGAFQWYQVFRMDALSYAALYAKWTGYQPPQVIPILLLGLALVMAGLFCKRSPAGFASGVAFCLFLFVAFSKQAFSNYYFLVLGIFCCAFAALPARDE